MCCCTYPVGSSWCEIFAAGTSLPVFASPNPVALGLEWILAGSACSSASLFKGLELLMQRAGEMVWIFLWLNPPCLTRHISTAWNVPCLPLGVLHSVLRHRSASSWGSCYFCSLPSETFQSDNLLISSSWRFSCTCLCFIPGLCLGSCLQNSFWPCWLMHVKKEACIAAGAFSFPTFLLLPVVGRDMPVASHCCCISFLYSILMIYTHFPNRILSFLPQVCSFCICGLLKH